jgi:hypothetical protein
MHIIWVSKGDQIMTTYSIISENGQEMSAGIQNEREAFAAAQRHADETRSTVTVACGDDEWEVKPSARTEDAWWAWHDADADRWSGGDDGTAEAERRCAAWVAGDSNDGPEVAP